MRNYPKNFNLLFLVLCLYCLACGLLVNPIYASNNDKSAFRMKYYYKNVENMERLKINDYQLEDGNIKAIRDYILTADYLVTYLHLKGDVEGNEKRAIGKVCYVHEDQKILEEKYEYSGRFNTWDKVTGLLKDYYSEETIKYQLNRDGFYILGNKIGVTLAAGEMYFAIVPGISKFTLIKNEKDLKLVEVTVYNDSEEEEKVVYTIELANKVWLITKIKGIVWDNSNMIELPYFSKWSTLQASSSLKSKDVSYDALNVCDGILGTAWVEGDSSDGVNEHLLFENPDEIKLFGLDIINGYSKSEDIYQKNNRVKRVQIELSNGEKFEYQLDDQKLGFQTLTFPERINTRNLKMTILDIYKGSKYNDTCISEIRFF